MKIFYLTATGNSLDAAKHFGTGNCKRGMGINLTDLIQEKYILIYCNYTM